MILFKGSKPQKQETAKPFLPRVSTTVEQVDPTKHIPTPENDHGLVTSRNGWVQPPVWTREQWEKACEMPMGEVAALIRTKTFKTRISIERHFALSKGQSNSLKWAMVREGIMSADEWESCFHKSKAQLAKEAKARAAREAIPTKVTAVDPLTKSEKKVYRLFKRLVTQLEKEGRTDVLDRMRRAVAEADRENDETKEKGKPT